MRATDAALALTFLAWFTLALPGHGSVSLDNSCRTRLVRLAFICAVIPVVAVEVERALLELIQIHLYVA
jgi:hypothetical protein